LFFAVSLPRQRDGLQENTHFPFPARLSKIVVQDEKRREYFLAGPAGPKADLQFTGECAPAPYQPFQNIFALTNVARSTPQFGKCFQFLVRLLALSHAKNSTRPPWALEIENRMEFIRWT
jgi:hypothetical protein